MQVSFTRLPDDDDFILDQLTGRLADDLREIGEVRRISQAQPDPGSKGVAELVLGTVTVLAGSDPSYITAFVDLIAAFVNRNNGRRVHLAVGDIQLTIDHPTSRETAKLIEVVRDAVERSR